MIGLCIIYCYCQVSPITFTVKTVFSVLYSVQNMLILCVCVCMCVNEQIFCKSDCCTTYEGGQIATETFSIIFNNKRD